MKYASAIVYGGKLITPSECNYESYRQLGLLCPCCKDPVFLRKDFTRNVKSNNVKVPSSFVHFKYKNKEEALVCEKRVKSITKEQFDHYQSVARDQRLKKLEDHFLDIFIRSEKYYIELKNDSDTSQNLKFFKERSFGEFLYYATNKKVYCQYTSAEMIEKILYPEKSNFDYVKYYQVIFNKAFTEDLVV